VGVWSQGIRHPTVHVRPRLRMGQRRGVEQGFVYRLASWYSGEDSEESLGRVGQHECSG
jgi:hypothetical protein